MRELDCRGLMCPMPILTIAEVIGEMAKGEYLRVVATDAAIKGDISAWSDATGNTLESFEEENDEYIFVLQKTS